MHYGTGPAHGEPLRLQLLTSRLCRTSERAQVPAEHGYRVGLSQPCELRADARLDVAVDHGIIRKQQPRFICREAKPGVLDREFGIRRTDTLAFEAPQQAVMRPGTDPLRSRRSGKRDSHRCPSQRKGAKSPAPA